MAVPLSILWFLPLEYPEVLQSHFHYTLSNPYRFLASKSICYFLSSKRAAEVGIEKMIDSLLQEYSEGMDMQKANPVQMRNNRYQR